MSQEGVLGLVPSEILNSSDVSVQMALILLTISAVCMKWFVTFSYVSFFLIMIDIHSFSPVVQFVVQC
jgi:hypothetical protein